MYTVYAHRNLKNGKSYVGMTSQEPKYRWDNGKGYKNQPKIWADIQNSDWNSDWQHEILGKFENEQDALKYEAFWIAMLDTVRNGYNSSTYSNYGFTEETRKKISESMTGEKNPFYGKHHSEETRKKISESMTGEKNPLYGKHHSEDTKRKMSEAHKEKIYANIKPILQCSKNGELIAEYSSLTEASRQTGCNNSHIGSCCKGNRKSCGGFIWKYKKI